MWLSKAANLLSRVARLASEALHSVGITVLGLMMLLTAADVTLRYAFDRPVMGSYDLTVYMMAIVVAFGLAYCAVMKGHVRVEVVVSRLPQRAQAIIDSITCLVSLGLFSLITWQCFVNMKLLFASKLTSSVLLIPVFPFAGVVGIGSACLTLVLLTDFFDFLSQAVRK
jgi:TRAP-type C4-dicarboxylate transport system permease small subunit